MTTTARERELRAAYGHEALCSFWQAARQRYENAGSSPARTFTWDASKAEERERVENLLGLERHLPAHIVKMRVDRIEAALRTHRLQPRLLEVLEALDGPLRDKPAERWASNEGWRRFDDRARADVENDPALTAWYEGLCQDGLLVKYSKDDFGSAENLWSQALAVIRALARLPPGDNMLKEFAAKECGGDSKALEPGHALGTLVIRAAAQMTGLTGWDESEGRRRIWRAVGICDDTVSSTVLVLNLTGDAHSSFGQVLGRQTKHSLVRTVSLHELEPSKLRFSRATVGPSVYVCENPTIIESAARRLRGLARPMVCINGQPRTAAHQLLTLLRDASIELHYHGDFDWWGIQIGNAMVVKHGAVAWRFSVRDYTPGIRRLNGPSTPALWDAQLQAAMERGNRAMDEESALDLLRSDLLIQPCSESGEPQPEALAW